MAWPRRARFSTGSSLHADSPCGLPIAVTEFFWPRHINFSRLTFTRAGSARNDNDQRCGRRRPSISSREIRTGRATRDRRRYGGVLLRIDRLLWFDNGGVGSDHGKSL